MVSNILQIQLIMIIWIINSQAVEMEDDLMPPKLTKTLTHKSNNVETFEKLDVSALLDNIADTNY